MKKTIRMTESELHRMISESVKRVLNETANEMSLHNRKTGKTFAYSPENTNWPPKSEDWKWRYDGDKVDRYMWAMKKEAEKTGNIGRNGWPTPEFADKWILDRFGRYDCSGEVGVSGDMNGDVDQETLYRAIDYGLFQKSLYDPYRGY